MNADKLCRIKGGYTSTLLLKVYFPLVSDNKITDVTPGGMSTVPGLGAGL